MQINFEISQQVLPGIYPVTFDLLNIQSGQKLSIGKNLTIKPRLTVDYFAPLRGPVGTDVTIYGHNLSNNSIVRMADFFGNHQDIVPSNIQIINGATSTIQFRIPSVLTPGEGEGKGASVSQSVGTSTILVSSGFYLLYLISDGIWIPAGFQFEVTPSLPPLLISCNGTQKGSFVEWTASAGGGTSPYNFLWSGPEGVTGTTATVFTPYTTSGLKTATVDVFSSNNEKQTASCSVNFVSPTVTPSGSK
jgi:hypothetical protein